MTTGNNTGPNDQLQCSYRFPKGRAETASLQEEEENTQGAKELKEKLVHSKPVLFSKPQKLWGFSLS